MRIIDYQVMPPLSDDEYKRLRDDIQENGQLIPIEVDEYGNILDGYNRMRICRELGLEPETVVRAGLTDNEKWQHALRLNVDRRHLSGEKLKAVILEFHQQHPDIGNREIARAVGTSHTTVNEVLKDRPTGNSGQLDAKTQGADGRSRPASETRAEQQRETIRETIVRHPEKSNRQIARETGASPTTVGSQRKKVVTVYNPSSRDQQALKDPDIVRRMAETGSNVAGAIREQKRDQLVEHLESVETREAKAVAGVYDVVVIDPPWPLQKIETDRRPLEVHLDYPVMSIDEIKALDIPTADNCHVFLWTTQKFLPVAFDILKEWRFKYVCTFVWHKVGGYKPLDLPRYDCEFCLYAHKGAPRFVDDHQFWTCFDGQYLDMPTNGHSVKPDEFYDMVRRVTAGRRLDMFNRRHIDGFDGWGKEA